MFGRLKDTANVYFDAEREEDGNSTQVLSDMLSAAKDHLRCWKAYNHSFNEKTRGALEKSWSAFKVYAQSGVNEHVSAFRFAVICDLCKASVNYHSNQDDIIAAAKVLSSNSLQDRYLASVEEVGLVP